MASETSSIDVIIGGHSHTFMDKPAMVKNKSGSQVIINQVGWGGVKLGQIDISLQKQSSPFAAFQHIIR